MLISPSQPLSASRLTLAFGGGGLVSISGDQISIALQLTGTDSNGNVIQAPIDVVVAINDGSAPVMVDEPTLSLNENDLPRDRMARIH